MLHTSNFFDVSFSLSNLGVIVGACVTLIVSLASYNATKTQRDIAANQYKLDLYVKRREVFDELIKWYSQSKSDEFKIENVFYLKKVLSDVSMFFTIDLEVINIEINRIIEYNHSISIKLVFDKSNKPEIIKEIREIQEEMIVLWCEILGDMEMYFDDIKKSLKVPQNPY